MTNSTSPPACPSDSILRETIIQHHQETLQIPMQEWQRKKQLPSVLLFTGQSGIGKKITADFLASWILCEHNVFFNTHALPLSNPCLHCTTCQRMQAGTEVNYLEIIPEDKEENLKIDQFRLLQTKRGLSAYENAYQIICIPQAHRMTSAAAHSLLKLLEETPPTWIFILTTEEASLLLPTLVSRCHHLRLKPFSIQEIQTFLKTSSLDAEKIKISAFLAQGSWERAMKWAHPDIWEKRKLLFTFLKNPISVFQTLLEWGSQDHTHFLQFLDLLELLVIEFLWWTLYPDQTAPLETLCIQTDGKSAMMTHWTHMTQSFGMSHAQCFWITQAEHLFQARAIGFTSANRKLLIQNLLLPWIESHQKPLH